MRDIGRGARHGSPAVARAKKHILLAGAALETIEPLSRCLIHRASGGPEMAELSSRSSGRPPVESGPTGWKSDFRPDGERTVSLRRQRMARCRSRQRPPEDRIAKFSLVIS